ncbi:MAG: ABC transporter permease, partial [Actinobacteria bacterium]|nr:ABC transporter permease [Actinomycetota bacterium]
MTRVRELLRNKWILVLLLAVVWIVLATVFKGVHTLELPTAQNTPVTQWLTDFASSIRGNRAQNPAFVYFFNPIRATIAAFIEGIRSVISVPAAGNVIPLIGWLGTLSIIGYIVYVTSNLRTSLLSMGLLLACGVLGMWVFTMDTLAMTMGAVFLSLAIGLPLGI